MDERDPVPFARPASPGVRKVLDEELPAVLEAAPDEPLVDTDMDAFEDAPRFRRRFGFDWPLADRLRLLHFRTDHDLTDAQLRVLQATGTLAPNPHGLRITAKRWEAAVGWFHVLALGVVFVPLLTLGMLAYGSRLTATQWLQLGLMATGLAALGAAFYYYYILPWRLRVRIARAESESD